MTRERRLGRGLESLLGLPFGGGQQDPQNAAQTPAPPVAADEVVPPDAASNHPVEGAVQQLNVQDIDPNPFQPRSEFDDDDLAELTESIQQHGLMQPVVVRPFGGRFQLIAGERRWRAAIRAGWSQVPVVVREADDRQVAELTIVENLQRRDLGALEKANSFHNYLERYHCTQEELAQRLSIDRSTVANLIRLLELPEVVREALRQQKITAGHARALLPLGEEREQVEFCLRIQQEQLSVRATEQLVAEMIHAAESQSLSVFGGEESTPPTRTRRDDHLASLEQEFRLALGTRVELRQSAKGRGRITVHFTSREEFDRLRALLCESQPPQAKAG